jgi:DNA-binding transcriptional MerR regulator
MGATHDTSPSAPRAARAAKDFDGGFSGAAAAEIAGITYRQLDYWTRTGLVSPSLAAASGSGSRRRYSYTDLLELRVIKSLLDAGIKLENVREAFVYLREELGQEITSASLVIQGSSSVVVRDDGELVDLVRRGQGVLNILPLDGLRDDMDARLRELHPAPAVTGATEDRMADVG